MRGRGLVVVLALGVLAAPLAAEAQPPGRVSRIGVLFPAERESPTEPNIAAFRQGLRDLGYVEGQTVAVEYRYAHGQADLLAALAAELVRLKVDVIVVGSGLATLATRDATKTIPIVFVGGGDPVERGLVASLARPGGNITGLSSSASVGSEFAGKWMELLKETVPGISHVGYLFSGAFLGATSLREMQRATQALGLKLRTFEVRDRPQLDSVFATMTRERVGGLVVYPDVFSLTHRARIADLAAKSRLPAVYGLREYVEDGGLMSYAASLRDLWRRAATYVDRILKGTKPADLPVEQPTRFELVINLKAARALGLTIPQSVLARTDEVIE